MRIVWRKRARADINAMAAFVARDSPSGAVRMYEQIEYSVGFLADWPRMGRLSRTPGIRELVIPHSPYVALYRHKRSAIYILRVLHGSQQR